MNVIWCLRSRGEVERERPAPETRTWIPLTRRTQPYLIFVIFPHFSSHEGLTVRTAAIRGAVPVLSQPYKEEGVPINFKNGVLE